MQYNNGNGNFYNNNQGGQFGYGYVNQPNPNQGQGQGVFQSSLTVEESKQVQGNKQTYFYNIPQTKVEMDRCVCNHKYPGTNKLSVVYNNDGTVTCQVCGATWHVVDPLTTPKEDIDRAIGNFKDIWESMKLYWGPVSKDVAKGIYPFTDVINKMPHMWDTTVRYVQSISNEQNQPYYQNGNMNAQAMLSGIYNGMPWGGAGFAPQYPQQPMAWGGQPQGYQAPQAPQGYVDPNQGYQQTSWGQQPQAPQGYQAPQAPNGFGQQPQAPAAPQGYQQPQAPQGPQGPVVPNPNYAPGTVPPINPIGTPVAPQPTSGGNNNGTTQKVTVTTPDDHSSGSTQQPNLNSTFKG